jgi:head-tail adaptor
VSEIVSGRMLGMLGKFYASACTIQVSSATQDAAGQPVLTWSDLADHEDLACRLAPAMAEERKRDDLVLARTTHTIALAGYYTTITPAMRAIVGTSTYDILGVEQDGNGITTRLRVEIVTV